MYFYKNILIKKRHTDTFVSANSLNWFTEMYFVTCKTNHRKYVVHIQYVAHKKSLQLYCEYSIYHPEGSFACEYV